MPIYNSSAFGRDLIRQYGFIPFPLQIIQRALITDCDDDGKLKLKIQLVKPKRSKLKTLLDFYY